MPERPGVDEVAARVRAIGQELGLAEGWLVGGAVRDLIRGVPVDDLDIVVQGDARPAAVAWARRSGGSPFPLSERHGAWRVVSDHGTLDVTPLAGSLDEDLLRRDFTVNAIAASLTDGALHDPSGGLTDLAAGQLRPVSDGVFVADPLRLLRLPRLAVELELEVTREASRLAARDAHLADRPAAERLLAELSRILGARDPIDALELCDRLGVLGAVLPEVVALHGVEQSRYHHLDVFEHTLHVLDAVADISAHVPHYLPEPAAGAVDAALDKPLDGTTDVRAALRWAALLHDIAKPWTRTELGDGQVKFYGHDEQGAATADRILERLSAGAALRRFARVMVREHLRLGFRVKELPLSHRAVYRYWRVTEPWSEAAIVLSLGDRLATRGSFTRLRGVRRHEEAAREMALGLVELAPPLPPLVRGDELAERLGREPGPWLAEALAALAEEQAAGAIRDAEAAVAFARGLAQEA